MARERIRGIDEPLPEGEHLLWQGRPDARALTRHVFHIRVWAAYFAVLAVVTFFVAPGGSLPRAVWLLLLGGLLVGGIRLYARATARTTTYAITDTRVVMGIGVGLPAVFNVPFSRIEDAAVRVYPDGTGDIALELRGSGRMGYIYLWPHARPWRLREPQPMLRTVPDVEGVAETLRAALLAADRSAPTETERVRISVMDDDGTEILSNDPTPTSTRP
jgi:hypothetical protein